MNIDIVAVILARGGSKRLPKKNLLPLSGKPMIYWTFSEALKSDLLDLVILSTDDDNLKFEAEKLGIKVFTRPEKLATDEATSFDALVHVLSTLNNEGVCPKRIMLLQPTSPLREVEDIDNAVLKMTETESKSVISVCETEHSPIWCNILDNDGRMDNFINEADKNKRSQDLPIYYRLNGAIYLSYVDVFLQNKGFIMSNSRAMIMSKERSVDIDTQLDFDLAEVLMNKKLGHNNT
jgi:CMP-N-acetylneuraminic acid synthetase